MRNSSDTGVSGYGKHSGVIAYSNSVAKQRDISDIVIRHASDSVVDISRHVQPFNKLLFAQKIISVRTDIQNLLLRINARAGPSVPVFVKLALWTKVPPGRVRPNNHSRSLVVDAHHFRNAVVSIEKVEQAGRSGVLLENAQDSVGLNILQHSKQNNLITLKSTWKVMLRTTDIPSGLKISEWVIDTKTLLSS